MTGSRGRGGQGALVFMFTLVLGYWSEMAMLLSLLMHHTCEQACEMRYMAKAQGPVQFGLGSPQAQHKVNSELDWLLCCHGVIFHVDYDLDCYFLFLTFPIVSSPPLMCHNPLHMDILFFSFFLSLLFPLSNFYMPHAVLLWCHPRILILVPEGYDYDSLVFAMTCLCLLLFTIGCISSIISIWQ